MENIRERKTKEGTSYQVYLVVDGRQVTKSFSTKKYGNKKNALEKAKEYKSKMLLGEITKPKKDTVKDVFEMCLDTFSRSVETHKKWTSAFNKYLKTYEDRPLTSITSVDIQKSLNKMVSKSSDDTIGRVLTVWKNIYKVGVIRGIVQTDETYKVEKPKSDLVESPKSQELDTKEFWSLIAKLDRVPQYKKISYALQVMYYTGMRPNEVYALEAKDIDTENKLISINKSIGSSSTRRLTVKKTKNANSIRVIPYNSKLDEIFDDLPMNGPLFLKEDGSYMDGNYVSPIIKRISKGKVHTYTLRHNFSTRLIEKGADLRTIQELMGHTSSSMTLSYARSNVKK